VQDPRINAQLQSRFDDLESQTIMVWYGPDLVNLTIQNFVAKNPATAKVRAFRVSGVAVSEYP
jgi:hypothetical protein